MDNVTRRENEYFEDEVRRIARELWPSAEFSGSTIVDGRERDGVFETEDCIHVVEATTSRRKEKAKEDIALHWASHSPFRGMTVHTGGPVTEPLNILLTGAGRHVGLVAAFRQSLARLDARGRVHVAERSPLSPALHLADDGILLPPEEVSHDAEALLEICRRRA